MSEKQNKIIPNSPAYPLMLAPDSITEHNDCTLSSRANEILFSAAPGIVIKADVWISCQTLADEDVQHYNRLQRSIIFNILHVLKVVQWALWRPNVCLHNITSSLH